MTARAEESNQTALYISSEESMLSDEHTVNSNWPRSPNELGLDAELHKGFKSRHSVRGDLGTANTNVIWIIKYMGLVFDGSVSWWCILRGTKSKHTHVPQLFCLCRVGKTSRRLWHFVMGSTARDEKNRKTSCVFLSRLWDELSWNK